MDDGRDGRAARRADEEGGRGERRGERNRLDWIGENAETSFCLAWPGRNDALRRVRASVAYSRPHVTMPEWVGTFILPLRCHLAAFTSNWQPARTVWRQQLPARRAAASGLLLISSVPFFPPPCASTKQASSPPSSSMPPKLPSSRVHIPTSGLSCSTCMTRRPAIIATSTKSSQNTVSGPQP